MTNGTVSAGDSHRGEIVLAGIIRSRWPDSTISRYSCERCFRRLWRNVLDRPADACDCLNTAASIEVRPENNRIDQFIIYDGIPPAFARPPGLPTIHFDALFSPFALAALEPDLRRVVIDPQRRSTGELELALARLLDGRVTVVTTDAAALFAASTARPLIPIACGLLRSELTRSSTSRHAVSNVVGAAALNTLFGTTETDDTDSRFATDLRTILVRLGLVHRTDQAHAAWCPPSMWADAVDTVVLLDDMHAHGWGEFLRHALGLPDAPLRTVGGRQEWGSRLALMASPATGFGGDGLESILDRLQAKGPLVFTEATRRELLFLDLRLFVLRPFEEQWQFYRDALRLAASLPLLAEPKLATVQDYLTACRERQAFDYSENYYQLLTLLPRLIATVDPMLPVVIFSSAAQRPAVALLADMPTLITGYLKPVLHGLESATPYDDNRRDFVGAVTQAVAFLRGRQALRELQDAIIAGPSPVPLPSGPLVEIYFDECGGVEKEEGMTVGGVALVCSDSGAPARLDAALAAEGLRWGVAEGSEPDGTWPPSQPLPAWGAYLPKLDENRSILPRYKPFVPASPPPHTAIDRIGVEARRLCGVTGGFRTFRNYCLRTIAEPFASLGITLVAFGYREPRPTAKPDTPDLTSDSTADQQYRRMMTDTLETLLFDVLRPAADRERTALRVDLGSRKWGYQWPYTSDGEQQKADGDIAIVHSWFRNFGVPPFADKYQSKGIPFAVYRRLEYQSLRADDALPLVQEVLARRPSGRRWALERARAVWLCDYETLDAYRTQAVSGPANPARFPNPQDVADYKAKNLESYRSAVTEERQPRPRQIHFLADWVVRDLHWQDHAHVGAHLTPHTVQQVRHPSLQYWLMAGRAADRGQDAEAVAHAVRGWQELPPPDRAAAVETGFVRWWLRQAGTWIARLDSAGFADFCLAWTRLTASVPRTSP